jgi:glutamate-1-semialdehyde 2,1-aminomutase
MTDPQSGVDRERVRVLKHGEDARLAAAHPRSAELIERGRAVMPNGVPMAWQVGSYHHLPMWVAEGKGTHLTDVDGNTYVDFNIADLSMFCGYAPEPLLRAVSEQMARGNQFLLPTEDAIVVSEELARRWGLPKWQYTSSATHANTEAIRVARVATGREKVLMFEGKYHGHLDEALVELDAHGRVVTEERGVPADTVSGTVLVSFNDVPALERALERRDIAIVLTEPAITNNIGLLLPDEGFHAALRRLTRETGTLLAYDETHTHVVGAGGLVRQWGLEPDVVVSGTIFGNALSMAAARAALLEILTPEAYAHTQRLGARLARGMRASVEAHGLPWLIPHLGPRSGYTFQRTPIRTGAEGFAAADELLTRLIRVWLANRGVWEAIVGAGPVCGVPCSDEDVDAYLAGWESLLDALTA